LAQLSRRLTHELGYQPIESDAEQRQLQFAGKRRRCHCLPGAGRADHQQFAAGRHSAGTKFVLLPILRQHPVKRLAGRLGQDHVVETCFRIRSVDEIGQFTDWTRERDGRPH
jgi:hypothetical protein